MKKIAFLLTILLAVSMQAYAQDPRWNDTVWYRTTDQYNGFYMLKFSPNDELIVGHTYSDPIDKTNRTVFYNTSNGYERARIEGNNEIFYFDNGGKFLRVSQNNPKIIEIYDANTFKLIDSLENDGEDIGSLGITKDGMFLIGCLKHGLRKWDLTTKKIAISKMFDIQEENLINYFFDHIYMGCNEVISVINKEYKTIEGKYLSHAVQTKHNIIDLHQLDTVPTKIHTVISKNCKYIAYKVLAELGVEIYDFNTNQLLRKLTVYGYTLTGVEFTPNEKYLVTSQTVGDNALTIWNVETGQKEYEYLPAGYQCIAISHDGKYLANGIRSIALYKLDIHTDIPPTNNTIIEVFPNPAFDNVNVELDKEYLNIKWAIIDLTGAAVLSGVQPSGNFSINTANLPSATYNLTLTIDGKSTSYPLIIAR